MADLAETKDGYVLNLKVIPNAKKNCLYEEGGKLKVKITAKPADGEANKALIKFLAKELKLKQKDIVITKGAKSREKSVLIKDAAVKEKLTKLKNYK